MSPETLREILALGTETRSVEFKASMAWTDAAARGKIARALMAMSNIRDGGVLIIGVDKQPGRTHVPTGLSAEHLSTYATDEVARYVQNYADPGVKFTIQAITLDGRSFLVFEVREFEEIPIVCRWNGEGLSRGAIYTRTGVPESVPVPGEAEMREIIETAVDKGLRRFIRRLSDAGLIRTAEVPERIEDVELFRTEARDLEDS